MPTPVAPASAPAVAAAPPLPAPTPSGTSRPADNDVLYLLPPEAWPNVDHLVTEDGTPVDNFLSEKQMRLLTEPLYSSWAGPGPGRPFLAAANVGLFNTVHQQPPLVPDVFLSLDVRVPENFWPKRHRSYFFWEFGKAPEAAIEIVSNAEREEDGRKLAGYARMGIAYYVIWDPNHHLGPAELRIFVLHGATYIPLGSTWLPAVGLGLTLWQGTFEGTHGTWLRWCDQNGQVIPTGAERAEQERQRAEQEHQAAEQERQRAAHERQVAEQERQRAEEERQRAEHERQVAEQERQRAEQQQREKEEATQRAERLAAQLRALGIEPQA